MLTIDKEECENALQTIENGTIEIEDYNSIPNVKSNPFGFEISLLKQLIKEHFDNPPLKFEELEEMIGKPIWCNKLKKWFLLREVLILNSGIKELDFVTLKYNRNEFDCYVCYFEENRFYKKQI